MAARRETNPLIVFLVIGIFVGAIAGYLTRPESAEIRLGPVNVEITGNQVAQGNGPLTGGQMRYIAMVTAIGGVLGLALGYGVKSGRFRI
ncbi:MAG TPA: hypothetical protein VEJ40_08305 [Pseudolabrys sp.]|jgi:hypothetical protein|nr:hypothetical protein [Pseudolabrys sp.]